MGNRYFFTCAVCHVKHATKQGMKIVDHKLTCRACKNKEINPAVNDMAPFEQRKARKQARFQVRLDATRG